MSKIKIAIINLRGVSTKLNKYIVFTMQTYKKNIVYFYWHTITCVRNLNLKFTFEAKLKFVGIMFK